MSAREGWFERLLVGSGFVTRYPRFVGAVSALRPVASERVEVMAVARKRLGGRVTLLVNVAYFEAAPHLFAGVLLHELQHVALGHLDNPALHVVLDGAAMEVAMEVSANELVREPLPDGVFLEAFTHVGLRPGQSTLERYLLLSRAAAEGRVDLSEFRRRTVDSHRARVVDGSLYGIGDALDARADRATARAWNRLLGLPTDASTLAAMRGAIQAHLRGERGGLDDARRDRSKVYAARTLERVYERRDGERRVDWARVLAEALATRRAVVPDARRPNRRFPDRVGEVPGRVRRPPRPRVLAVVDTSASMSVDTLGRIAGELPRIARTAAITVAESDASVHRVYAAEASRGPFLGGGDTDFAPALALPHRTTRVDAVVYFTDGRGALPEAPPAVPVVWALTHDDPFDAPWGFVVRLGSD